jgi:Cu-processing system permease protein
MIRQTVKVMGYEIRNLARSRWMLVIGLFFFLASEAMLLFGGDPARAMAGMMNLILIFIPLMSLILGIIHFYHSREFVELLLAQPITRSSVYIGKVSALSVALSLVFAAGFSIPFFLDGMTNDDWRAYATILLVGCTFIAIFTAIAFMVATLTEDRIKGFGSAILIWIYLSVIYDGLILVAIYVFREYPMERALIPIVALNPIDLGRILVLLRLDLSALMGYTGAVFRDFFGTSAGAIFSAVMLGLWLAVPLALGLASFRRKDF